MTKKQTPTVTKVIQCDYCEIKHATREAAIKCCGVMRAQVFYKCLLCDHLFEVERNAKDCAKRHVLLQEQRKDELAKYQARRDNGQITDR